MTSSVSVNTNPSPSSELCLWAGGPAGPLQHRRRLRPQLLSVLVQDRRVRPRLKVLEATDLQTPNENVMPRILEVGGGGGCCSDLDRVAGHQEVPRLGLGQHVPHGQLLVLHHVLHRVDRALNESRTQLSDGFQSDKTPTVCLSVCGRSLGTLARA